MILLATLLVVNAHPSGNKKSRSLQICDDFLQAYQVSHPHDKITTLDLYHSFIPQLDQDIITAWQVVKKQPSDSQQLTTKQKEKLARYLELIEQFVTADKLVIVNPLWNLNIPSRLKDWFDIICLSGVTFKYTDTGSTGLMNDKKALHIQASGGNYGGEDLASQYIKTILNFLGITDLTHLEIGGLDRFPEQVPTIMAEAKHKAIQLGTNF